MATIFSRRSKTVQDTWKLFRWGIVESAWSTRFVEGTEPAEGWGAFDAGLMFGPDGEMRWRKMRTGDYRLVAIIDRAGGSTAKSGDGWTPADLNGLESEMLPERVILWGEPQGNQREWYEPRTPRIITEYPAGLSGKRVGIRLKHYVLRTSTPRPIGSEEPGVAEVDPGSETTITRYVEVIGVEER